MIQSDSLASLMKDSSREVTCFAVKAFNYLRQACSRITLLMQEKNRMDVIIVTEYSHVKVILLHISVFTEKNDHSNVTSVIKASK
jgi:hypothetical protein